VVRELSDDDVARLIAPGVLHYLEFAERYARLRSD
jgi:hypothetical protein